MSLISETLKVSRTTIYTNKEQFVNKRFNERQEDGFYLNLIKKYVEKHQSYGYRRVCALINRELRLSGLKAVNHKRIYRLMKINNLLLKRGTRKPIRTHEGKIIVNESNKRWCSDAFELNCENGEKVRAAFIKDCHDREVISVVATNKGIDSQMVCDMLTVAVEKRNLQKKIRNNGLEFLTDNGSCFTAERVQNFCREIGIKLCTTPYASPESNGMAESMVARFKEDYAQFEKLTDAETVIHKIYQWAENYNEVHPHSALKYLSPREYIKQNQLVN